MDELFSDAAARLAAHPKMGKPGKIAGTRELIPHKSYRLMYEIEGGPSLGAGPGAYRPPVAAGAMTRQLPRWPGATAIAGARRLATDNNCHNAALSAVPLLKSRVFDVHQRLPGFDLTYC